MQADSLLAEPQGKPKNTGVGSLILSPEGLPDPKIELGSPVLQADSLPTELRVKSLLFTYFFHFILSILHNRAAANDFYTLNT